ncbi:MAG: dihydropteroate synthase [bacterium]
MGILNLTPNSFSDGGKYQTFKQAITHAVSMIESGADIIDIGGESTRPGAPEVSEQQEIDRVIPVVEELKKLYPELVLSIDTTKSKVALEALKLGADIINDISGLQFDEKIAEYVAEYNKALIIMHIKGVPRTMQVNPEYCDCTQEVFDFLQNKINLAKSFGVKKVIADIGIGFGKTYQNNWELLRNLSKFEELNVPLALGISRKTFIGILFNIPEPAKRDVETAFIHSLLLDKKVDIIRVHNVELYKKIRDIYYLLNNAN